MSCGRAVGFADLRPGINGNKGVRTSRWSVNPPVFTYFVLWERSRRPGTPPRRLGDSREGIRPTYTWVSLGEKPPFLVAVGPAFGLQKVPSGSRRTRGGNIEVPEPVH